MGKNSDHALEVLGFYQLLELIGTYVQSSAGGRIIRRLRPSSEHESIFRRRSLYADLLKLREGARSLPGLLVEELDDVLARLQPRDAVADGSELLMCGSQLSAVAEVREFAAHPDCAGLSAFLELTGELDDCPQLRSEIMRSLDSDGTVLDSASPRLREIRRSRSDTERRLEHTLDGILRNAGNADALQDKFVTRRNGRYVIPVRRDAQRAIPGLVHDVSSSGQTIFVEPAETLAMGNAVQMLAGEERAEVRRILAALSAGVRNCIDALRRNGKVLAELDAAAAVARWGSEYNCVLPGFGRKLELHGARHPLLAAQFRRDGGQRTVVPLDITLPAGTGTLAITGSNTGGKTVALKTVGLLTLAAQSGLPVPVGADSVFEIFQHVLADIGDEQSISENLSTYSGHLRNISSILRVTGDGGRALVLLDELGSGTDPLEGGAIACSVLTELAGRNTLVFATTHLGVVKNFVHATPGMVNAAVRFNVENLQPEYVLDIGRPGASHAMMIARRLGIPGRILQRAQSFLSGDQLQLEKMLARMDRDQRSLAENTAAAEAVRIAVEKEREELQRQREELRRNRKKLMNEAYQRADALVDNTRRDLENLVRGIREREKRGENPTETRADVDSAVASARRSLSEKGEKIAAGISSTALKPASPPIPKAQLVVGKKIWVEKLSAHGRIARIDTRGKEVVVDVDGIPFTLKVKEIFAPKPGSENDVKPETTVAVQMPRFTGQTCHEINVIGMRVDEALAQISRYLSNCAMAHLDEVRIVHGFGTGRLREGIHQWLRHQGIVDSFRQGIDQHDAGGAGVTFVKLAR